MVPERKQLLTDLQIISSKTNISITFTFFFKEGITFNQLIFCVLLQVGTFRSELLSEKWQMCCLMTIKNGGVHSAAWSKIVLNKTHLNKLISTAEVVLYNKDYNHP